MNDLISLPPSSNPSVDFSSLVNKTRTSNKKTIEDHLLELKESIDLVGEKIVQQTDTVEDKLSQLAKALKSSFDSFTVPSASVSPERQKTSPKVQPSAPEGSSKSSEEVSDTYGGVFYKNLIEPFTAVDKFFDLNKADGLFGDLLKTYVKRRDAKANAEEAVPLNPNPLAPSPTPQLAYTQRKFNTDDVTDIDYKDIPPSRGRPLQPNLTQISAAVPRLDNIFTSNERADNLVATEEEREALRLQEEQLKLLRGIEENTSQMIKMFEGVSKDLQKKGSGPQTGGGSGGGWLEGLLGFGAGAAGKKALTFASSIAKRAAPWALPATIAYGAANVADWGLGKLGVGVDEEGNPLQINKQQDEENWKRMTFGQKFESSMGRGVEKLGSFVGFDNVSRQAEFTRIENETKYLKELDDYKRAQILEEDRKKVDEENWKRMSFTEKMGSGFARGIEKVGSFIPGAGTLVENAKQSRREYESTTQGTVLPKAEQYKDIAVLHPNYKVGGEVYDEDSVKENKPLSFNQMRSISNDLSSGRKVEKDFPREIIAQYKKQGGKIVKATPSKFSSTTPPAKVDIGEDAEDGSFPIRSPDGTVIGVRKAGGGIVAAPGHEDTLAGIQSAGKGMMPRRTGPTSQSSTRPSRGGQQSAPTFPVGKQTLESSIKPARQISGDEDIKQLIKQHEGVRLRPYKDSNGLWTVGIGHLIGDGRSLPPEYNREFTMEEVEAMFEEDYAAHKQAATQIPGFNKLNRTGQAALTDLTFNMGPVWYKKWPSFTKAISKPDTKQAAVSLERSKWYGQVGNRAPTITAMVRAGADDGQAKQKNLPESSPQSKASPGEDITSQPGMSADGLGKLPDPDAEMTGTPSPAPSKAPTAQATPIQEDDDDSETLQQGLEAQQQATALDKERKAATAKMIAEFGPLEVIGKTDILGESTDIKGYKDPQKQKAYQEMLAKTNSHKARKAANESMSSPDFQYSRQNQLAKQLGIMPTVESISGGTRIDSKLDTELEGGVITRINGKEVPTSMLTDYEIERANGVRQMRAMSEGVSKDKIKLLKRAEGEVAPTFDFNKPQVEPVKPTQGQSLTGDKATPVSSAPSKKKNLKDFPQWAAKIKFYQENPGMTPASHMSKFLPGVGEEYARLAKEKFPQSDHMQSIDLHERLLAEEAKENIRKRMAGKQVQSMPVTETAPDVPFDGTTVADATGEFVVPEPVQPKEVNAIPAEDLTDPEAAMIAGAREENKAAQIAPTPASTAPAPSAKATPIAATKPSGEKDLRTRYSEADAKLQIAKQNSQKFEEGAQKGEYTEDDALGIRTYKDPKKEAESKRLFQEVNKAKLEIQQIINERKKQDGVLGEGHVDPSASLDEQESQRLHGSLDDVDKMFSALIKAGYREESFAAKDSDTNYALIGDKKYNQFKIKAVYERVIKRELGEPAKSTPQPTKAAPTPETSPAKATPIQPPVKSELDRRIEEKLAMYSESQRNDVSIQNDAREEAEMEMKAEGKANPGVTFGKATPVTTAPVTSSTPVTSTKTISSSDEELKIAGERFIPGQPLSDKQIAVIGMSKSMGNKYSPEVEKQYALQTQGTPTPATPVVPATPAGAGKATPVDDFSDIDSDLVNSASGSAEVLDLPDEDDAPITINGQAAGRMTAEGIVPVAGQEGNLREAQSQTKAMVAGSTAATPLKPELQAALERSRASQTRPVRSTAQPTTAAVEPRRARRSTVDLQAARAASEASQQGMSSRSTPYPTQGNQQGLPGFDLKKILQTTERIKGQGRKGGLEGAVSIAESLTSSLPRSTDPNVPDPRKITQTARNVTNVIKDIQSATSGRGRGSGGSLGAIGRVISNTTRTLGKDVPGMSGLPDVGKILGTADQMMNKRGGTSATDAIRLGEQIMSTLPKQTSAARPLVAPATPRIQPEAVSLAPVAPQPIKQAPVPPSKPATPPMMQLPLEKGNSLKQSQSEVESLKEMPTAAQKSNTVVNNTNVIQQGSSPNSPFIPPRNDDTTLKDYMRSRLVFS